MIIPSTGEVSFDDGLRIAAHTRIASLLGSLTASQVSARPLPIEGWQQHMLGEHSSDFGTFTVEVATGFERRVEGVFLSHCHPFYDTAAPDDAERRVFHESVITSDLFGQREFPWGQVFCRLDRQANRDWLVVIYSPFSAVPLQQREVYRVLFAHEPTPGE
jgi:hypothetical protein